MLSKLNKDELSKNWQTAHPPAAAVRPATDEEPENKYLFEVRDSFTDFEIEALFPKRCLGFIGWYKGSEKKEAAYSRIKAQCVKMRLWPLESYTVIKNREAHTFAAADDYPIFIVDEESFKLIYQPLHSNKEAVYQYYGDRKGTFLHGLAQAQAEMKKREEKALEEDDYSDDPDAEPEKKKAEKLDEIIIAANAADAFGPALIGYWTVYHGGTDHELESWDFTNIAKLAKKVYQVRNNTDDHKRHAHQTALDNLDLYTVELPEYYEEELREGGMRRHPVISLSDYFTWNNDYNFKELMRDSLPYRFWEQTIKYVGRGKDRVKVGMDYSFDNVQAYNFLNKMGFYRLPVEGEKTDYIYIRKDGNIIRKHKSNDVKNFIHKFLKERRVDKELRNTIFTSAQLSENSLSNLEETEIDFTDYDQKRQFMFFENGTFEITAKNIKLHDAGMIKRYVWDVDLIEHHVSKEQPAFTVSQHNDGKSYDITVNHHDCLFFNYLIQTSRMHWRRELEEELPKKSEEFQAEYRRDRKFEIDSDLLTGEERFEQKQHLLNKIYSIGYLMHRYKNRSQSWAVVGVDNMINSDGRSHGGSGKSICFNQAIGQVLKNVFKIPGTNPNITQNPHIFHGLTKHHRLTIIDDADKYLNFRFFFEYITGDQVVNPKNAQPYTIPFDELAKLVWLTNFSFTTDPSTNRRILYTAFSDYYHAKSDNNTYKGSYEPKDDFGKELFKEFTPEEYNHFYNTMAYCLQFYLSCPIKLNSPMKNVDKRNLQREMGELLENWASLYFSAFADNINKYIVKEEAWQEFQQTLPKMHHYTVNKFKAGIAAFCKYNGYVFNPPELINDKEHNRIIQTVTERKLNNSGWAETGKKKAMEMLYIQTNFEDELNKALPDEKTSF